MQSFYPDELPGPIAGRFRLHEQLGRGGIAQVFSARDEHTGLDVALKLLPRYGEHEAVTPERVEAETTLGGAVSHANLCRVLAGGHDDDGRPFLITEALAGETLGQRLRRLGRLPVAATLHLAHEAATGLAALHRAGIVHRDVKPDNLFLCDELRHGVAVKVIDFGFATRAGRAPDDPMHVPCTLHYTAPEQAIGDPVDARSDVYALGLVLFRALTGELPFESCSDREMIRHHLESPVPPPSWLREDVPPAVDAIVVRATRKHPGNRYADMPDLCADLQRVLDGCAPGTASSEVLPDRFRPRTEHGWAVLGALVGERAG
jgi:serine/threonine protein kinase